MANYLMLPPGTKSKTITSFNGRTYSASLGSTVTAPDFDADVLGANGWIRVAQVGTTAQRPASPGLNMLFHDTTLGYVVVWEGAAWRNPNTGASV